MLDLAGLPRGALAGALQYNLEHFQSLPKVYDHFLASVATHMSADAAWLRRTLRENRPVSEDYQIGSPRHRDEALIGRFLRQERPEVPRRLLLSPLRVRKVRARRLAIRAPHTSRASSRRRATTDARNRAGQGHRGEPSRVLAGRQDV